MNELTEQEIDFLTENLIWQLENESLSETAKLIINNIISKLNANNE